MSTYISDPFVAPVVIRAYRKRRPYQPRPTYSPVPSGGPAYSDFFAQDGAAALSEAS